MPDMTGFESLLRCATVLVEPREDREFSLADLLGGGAGLVAERRWLAYAPHLDHIVEIGPAEVLALAHFSPREATGWRQAAETPTLETVNSLLEKSLLFDLESPASPQCKRDQQLRSLPWWTLASVAHHFSRWTGVDSGGLAGRVGLSRPQDLRARFGPPPPAVPEDVAETAGIALPEFAPSSLDRMMARRTTCRNFDSSTSLSLLQLSILLKRSFGALAVTSYGPGIDALKKNSPSAGGLHPVEPYLLVQRVDGLASGRYRYNALENSLVSLDPSAPAADVPRLLAGQPWFADAPVLVVLVARFRRNFWKYREHAKAYRGLLLDAGHLAQTFQLAATEQGLGAFVTAAVNETDIEAYFELDPVESGVLAVCGAGARSGQQAVAEFDPLGLAWPTS